LRMLVVELRNIAQSAAIRTDVDFADTPKQSATTEGQRTHDTLERILRSAHAEYARKSIRIAQQTDEKSAPRKGPGAPRGHQAFQRLVPVKANKIIRVRRPCKCPRHKGQMLDPSEKKSITRSSTWRSLRTDVKR
jgi:hypothetical protein